MDQILDAKLKAINAEATAIRAAEIVQATISEFSNPGVSTEDSPQGFMDVRGGFLGGQRKTKEVEDESD